MEKKQINQSDINPSINEHQNEDEIDLINIIKIILKRKWLIILGVVIPTFFVLILGLIFSKRTYFSEYIYSLPEWTINDIILFQEILFREERIEKIADNLSDAFQIEKNSFKNVLLESKDTRENFIQISTIPDLTQKDAKVFKTNILKILLKTPFQSNFIEIKKIFESKILYEALEERDFSKKINEQIEIFYKLENEYVKEKRDDALLEMKFKDQIKEYKRIRSIYGDLTNIQVTMSTMSQGTDKDKSYLPNREQMPIRQQITTLEVLHSDIMIKIKMDEEKHNFRKKLITHFSYILDNELLNYEKINTYFQSLDIKDIKKTDIDRDVYEYLDNFINHSLKSWQLSYSSLRKSPTVTPQSRGLGKKVILTFFISLFFSIIVAFLYEYLMINKNDFFDK